MARPGYILI